MAKFKKARYTNLIVATLVLAIFLAGSFLYISVMRQRNEQQGIASLYETAAQRQKDITRHVESDFQIMRGVAISLSVMDWDDVDKIVPLLVTLNRSNNFVRMGLATTQGNVDFVDMDGSIYRDVNISKVPVFQQALQGHDAVSETVYEEETGEWVNYYAIPVLQSGEIVAVLCAANSEDVLHGTIDMPVFQEAGCFALIDSAGMAVAALPFGSGALPGTSFFDAAAIPPQQRRTLEESVAQRRRQSFTFSMDGEKHTAVLQPVQVNDWAVLAVVPSITLSGYYNYTMYGTIAIVAGACIIFLFLMYRQIRLMDKSHLALERLAYKDQLTGLRNYAKFQLDSNKLLKETPGQKYAVWSFDIKKFFSINDIFGNSTGNRVLKRVACLLQEDSEQAGGLCCRISGDQFAGLYPYAEKEQLKSWFLDLISRLIQRDVIAENQMHIDVAMGLYCLEDFDNASSVNDMVNRASAAKREAKKMAGNAMRFFTHEMSERVRRQNELEAAGTAALAKGEFTFFLQPKVSIQNGFQIIGAEVLARWNHSASGWVSPAEFIPLFESNGFVVELDRYIFEQACSWYVRWRAEGGPPLRLAVNVSRQGLLHEDFIDHYTAVKEKYKIPNRVLELEFTESMVLEDYRLFHDKVEELQRRGFVCSIDDFGSGYSSLNVLKNLPIDVLKLDILFFQNSLDERRERTVVANLVNMAKQLNIKVVAEGVESHKQVEFLRQTRCDVIQGYVFSKPLPKREFLSLMQRTRGSIWVQEPKETQQNA